MRGSRSAQLLLYTGGWYLMGPVHGATQFDRLVGPDGTVEHEVSVVAETEAGVGEPLEGFEAEQGCKAHPNSYESASESPTLRTRFP